MDPPPPPPPSSSLFPTADSPNSRHDAASAWDDHPKLRLMCSYGGHIIPRPHDKSLCYVGGDTRIVVLDRHCSLSDLRSRLSHSLLNGRHFTLKYQLPSEDLDSLISLAADEDLDNMIDEYDRTSAAASPLKPPRLRLFLFPSKPETAASMGSLLDDAKSETWFVDALNGSGLLTRGLSESAAAVDTLLEVDRGMASSDSCADLGDVSKQLAPAKREQVVDSPPVVETSSSSGSSSSSPSMANLPPIKVRAEEYLMVGLDEQFSSHMSIAPNLAPPPLPFVNAVRSGGGGDDEKSEKSDHGTVAPTRIRKPPLPLQPVQRKLVDVHNLPSPDSKHATAYSLPSPDSVASDCSIASGGSLSKHAMYPDAAHQNRAANSTPVDPKTTQDPPQVGDWSQQQQQQQHQQQQQFIPSTHYIHHHTPMQPLPSYYPVYLHHQTQHADPQFPMYLMSSTQPSYDASSRPHTPTVYPAKPEMPPPANMHQMVQVPAHQFQQHYIGVQQMQPTPIPNAAAAAAAGGGGGSNYGYEYSNHMQDQAYYAQQMSAQAAPPPPQYQTMTPAAAGMFSQASTQIPPDGNPPHS